MNAHILVVDDSGFARRTIRKILESAGHSVEEAKDGHDALERYFLRKPDLVMLDMVMEGMTGLEVLTKMRELDPQARIVLATADIQTATRTEGQAAGASGIVTKPFEASQVLNAVSTILDGGVVWS